MEALSLTLVGLGIGPRPYRLPRSNPRFFKVCIVNRACTWDGCFAGDVTESFTKFQTCEGNFQVMWHVQCQTVVRIFEALCLMRGMRRYTAHSAQQQSDW